MGLKLGLVLLLVTAISIPIIQAEAISVGTITAGAPTIERNKGYAIGIILSNSCIVLVKSGSDLCPSYQDLMIFDNSIPAYSGEFKEVNGFYKRMPPKLPNSMGFYQYDPTFRIFVDPPKVANLPLITIETKLTEYHISGQLKVNEIKDYSLKDSKATKSARSYSHTWYVDSTCSYGTVTARDWKTVLPAVINYMKADCDPNKINIGNIGLDIKDLTAHDITTSAKWKLDKLYETIKRDCLKEYGKCNTIQQATRAGYDDTIPVHHTITLSG